MADLKDFAEKLVNLTVKEVNELADILKEEYGIEPAAAAAVAVAGPAGGAGGADAAEEKSEFTVVLKAAGGAKLAVVKLVKELTGLGLKEAKDLVDNAPSNIKEDVGKDEADLKNKLIYFQSPIGKGLIGKCKKDLVEINTPAGTKNFEIKDVRYI